MRVKPTEGTLNPHTSRCGTQKFFFEEHAVGCFEDQLPSSPGRYRYLPFDGPGHLHLVKAVASSGPQRCYYLTEGKRHYFIVLNAASEGFLLVHAHTQVND